MGKVFFITGTDTGVGKTLVSAAILLGFKKLGYNVGALKPVETGCRQANGELKGSDSHLLACACNNENDSALYRYALPAAPLTASKKVGKKIDTDLIYDRCKQMSDAHAISVIEGVGGLFVPLADDFFVLNLIVKLDFPVIIVARDSLGTINHTLLTYNQLACKGVKVAGVVINSMTATNDKMEIEIKNEAVEYLRGYFLNHNIPVLGRIPFIKEDDPIKSAHIASTFIDISSFNAV